MRLRCVVCGKLYKLGNGYTLKNAPIACATCLRHIREARVLGVES